jgi:hypothetical protein
MLSWKIRGTRLVGTLSIGAVRSRRVTAPVERLRFPIPAAGASRPDDLK